MIHDIEQILITGVLLHGRPSERFNEKYFEHYPKTLAAAKKHRTADGLVDIAKVCRANTEVSFSDIADMGKDYFDNMWDSAYKRYLEAEFIDFAQNMTEATTENLRKLDEMKNELLLLEPDVEPLGDDLLNYWDVLGERGSEKTRMMYGIPKLDEYTGGIKRNEFIVLAARPSVGKSALALQIAENVSKVAKVMLISCEMSREQIVDRRILRHSKVNQFNLKSGHLTKEESVDVSLTLDKLSKIMVFDKTYTLNGVKSTVAKYRPDLLIIDYITLLTNGKHNTKREEIASITRELKKMSLSGNMAIMGLAQVNRGGDGRMPCLADLKESGTLEEDADVVILLHRPSEDEKGYWDAKTLVGDYTPIKVLLDKNRNGITGITTLGFIGDKYTFKEPYREG